MTIRGKYESMSNIALLDSTSTHTILTNLKLFEFSAKRISWQHCNIVTLARSRKLKFQDSWAVIGMLGKFPFICERTMYAPEAPRNLISYRDSRASQIHVFTAMNNDDEVLELRQGQSLIVTTHAGNEGLYRLIIEPITSSSISLTDKEEVCMAARDEGPWLRGQNMAKEVSRDTTTKHDL